MTFMKSRLMERMKMTALINLFSIAKLPLLAFITPEFVELSDDRSAIRVRLGYRTKNHLKVMYFGALSMGAELSVAAPAVYSIHKSGQRIDFLFKDFEAKFLKRADGNVLFTCDQVQDVYRLIEKAEGSPERFEHTFNGIAYVEGKDEPVMKYRLTLSVKNRSIKQ